MSKKALIVIDMQNISFTLQTPRFDAEGVVQRINGLSSIFRRRGNPVLFIQHDGSKEGECRQGTAEWELLPELDIASTDLIVGKTANDAFYRSGLQQILGELDIRELVVTGCATDFCVEATVQSALAKDYEVTVVQDGHTTADRPHATAEQLIAHYNWVWKHMTPTNGRLRVVPAQDIQRQPQTVRS